MPHIPNTQTLLYTVFVISYLPSLSPKPCTCNETYFPVDNFCICNFGTEFSMHTKQVRNFLWFLMPLFTETKDKITVTQCWDHFMFLWHQLSKGRGDEWGIFTSSPPCPGESLSVSPSNPERAQGNHPHNLAHRPLIVSYSKPTKQHTPPKKEKKNPTGSMNWKATINFDPQFELMLVYSLSALQRLQRLASWQNSMWNNRKVSAELKVTPTSH